MAGSGPGPGAERAGLAGGSGLAERVAQLEASTAELLQAVAQLQAQGQPPRSPGRVNVAPRSGDAASPVRVMPAAAEVPRVGSRQLPWLIG